MTRTISAEEYSEAFQAGSADSHVQELRKSAYEHALDIRKFEIQLYWTRAAYFWTFIAAALAAYGGIQTVKDPVLRQELTVPLSCIGLVFAFAWYFVNRGSKHWQENWENHVDLLENQFVGPLYKVVLSRHPAHSASERINRALTGPGSYSVSKINQIVSVYICSIWGILLVHALNLSWSGDARVPIKFVFDVGFMLMAVALMWTHGRTHLGPHTALATLRSVSVCNAQPSDSKMASSD